MSWPSWLPEIGWLDVVDVLILAVLLYRILLLLQGTRAVQMLIGVLVLAAAHWLTGAHPEYRLHTLHAVLGYLLTLVPLAMIVIFQNPIRRALATLGNFPWTRSVSASARTVEDVVLACLTLSSQRIGALIVVEGQQGLRNHAETGIDLDAVVSYDLLVNLFTPHTPLHDGAVILRGDRLVAASCFLPLTADPQLSRMHGTRHRAAIGISEETDAIAIVVSEERGTVSVAQGGRIQVDLNPSELRTLLSERLSAEPAEPTGAPSSEGTDAS